MSQHSLTLDLNAVCLSHGVIRVRLDTIYDDNFVGSLCDDLTQNTIDLCLSCLLEKALSIFKLQDCNIAFNILNLQIFTWVKSKMTDEDNSLLSFIEIIRDNHICVRYARFDSNYLVTCTDMVIYSDASFSHAIEKDSSRNNATLAYAVFHSHDICSYNAKNVRANNIGDAEVKAILFALDDVRHSSRYPKFKNSKSRIIIRTDSIDAITRIQQNKVFIKNPVNKVSLLRTMVDYNISLQWVPSNVNIVDNISRASSERLQSEIELDNEALLRVKQLYKRLVNSDRFLGSQIIECLEENYE